MFFFVFLLFFPLFVPTDQKGFLNTCRVANKVCGLFLLAILFKGSLFSTKLQSFPLFVPTDQKSFLNTCRVPVKDVAYFCWLLFKGGLFTIKLHSLSLLLLTDQMGFLNTCRDANKGCSVFVPTFIQGRPLLNKLKPQSFSLFLLTDHKGFLNSCRLANHARMRGILAGVYLRAAFTQEITLKKVLG